MWQELQKIWDLQVWVIDGQAVTVGMLAISLAVFAAGLVVSSVAVRVVTRRLAGWTHLRESSAATLDKVLRYILYVMVALFALRIVNIPLGVFAFLGGAMAIGVGLGAQNLINNFISGFIIMTERPMQVGDLVEVDGVVGRVEEVGGRSTRVRTGESIHILVPNSSFLENNIINWTLSDHQIRSKVVVGVAYGSPTRKVEELLLQAARETEGVLPQREAFVLFTDFGDNALIFEVHFWIKVDTVVQRRRIESAVRFRIDELLRGAGVTIAFPQRDVHLDTLSPLAVRLEGGPGPKSDAGDGQAAAGEGEQKEEDGAA